MDQELERVCVELINKPGLSKTFGWVNSKSSRYYFLYLGQDMFGSSVIKREWGSLDTARHGGKTEIDFNYQKENPASLINRIKRIIHERESHGYEMVFRPC